MLVPEHAGGHLTLVSSLMWCIVVAGGVGALLGAASLGFVERFASVRPTRLFPALLTLVLIGTVGERSLPSDLVVVGLVGLLGYVMSALEWPRAPLVLGFVLGPLLEQASAAVDQPLWLVVGVETVGAAADRGCRRVSRGHDSHVAQH